MAEGNTIAESKVEIWREKILAAGDASRPRITVCGGTVCLALASGEVGAALEQALEQQGMQASVEMKTTGCPGLCDQGPLVTIYPQGIFYTKVIPEDCSEIISQTVKNGEIIEHLLYEDPLTGKKIIHITDVPFYKECESFGKPVWQNLRVVAEGGESLLQEVWNFARP